jgi:ubiquinone/menaquinone biosynthesis C-methylase UbiE
MAARANESERERWNDERRYSAWPRRERLTEAVTPLLVDAVAAAAGERIVDVGAGGGRSALAAGQAVGPEGAVVGVDISEGLLRLAAERTSAANADNVTFVLADAQTDAFPGAPFDAAMSQFGVMFFDDPTAAFTNIRSHLRSGGRLAFACWQPLEANRWYVHEAVEAFIPPAPPPELGQVPTGPFSLADAEQTTRMLERAGFVDVRCEQHELDADAPEDTVLDELQLTMMGVPPERVPEAMAAARAYLDRFRIDGGLLRFPIAFLIFTASTP